jgi:Zn finger protein HypA/HybF involved in hydrogenase expression
MGVSLVRAQPKRSVEVCSCATCDLDLGSLPDSMRAQLTIVENEKAITLEHCPRCGSLDVRITDVVQS